MRDSFHLSDKITSDTGTDNEMKDKDPQDNDTDEANKFYDDSSLNLDNTEKSNAIEYTQSSEYDAESLSSFFEMKRDEDVNPEVHHQNLPLRDEEIKENINEDEKEEM
jgi:hypothetical protein